MYYNILLVLLLFKKKNYKEYKYYIIGIISIIVLCIIFVLWKKYGYRKDKFGVVTGLQLNTLYTYNNAISVYAIDVPSDAKSAEITAIGGAGGMVGNTLGSGGAKVTTKINLSANNITKLNVYVGGNGSNGKYVSSGSGGDSSGGNSGGNTIGSGGAGSTAYGAGNGGGGGATAIYDASSINPTLIAVAGGGGGAGASVSDYQLGDQGGISTSISTISNGSNSFISTTNFSLNGAGGGGGCPGGTASTNGNGGSVGGSYINPSYGFIAPSYSLDTALAFKGAFSIKFSQDLI